MNTMFYEMVKAMMLERELDAKAHRYGRSSGSSLRAAARSLAGRGRRAR